MFTVVLPSTAAKRDLLLYSVDEQVFNDSAVPSPHLEMLDTLRGTGIQVELHEVKMIASIDSIMVLEGCYRIPPRR